MSASNKTITILGSATVVQAIHIFPQADGTFAVSVVGSTSDSIGNSIKLTDAVQSFPSNTSALTGLMAPALSILLTANGLGS